MKRGEIWWASLPDPVGSESGYRRPMLIVQSDEFNRSGIRTVICAAVTSNLNLAGAPGNVHLSTRASGLPKPSVVNVTQIATIDHSYVISVIGHLSYERLLEIWEGVRLAIEPAKI